MMGELVVSVNGEPAIRFGVCMRCGSREVATFLCHHGKRCRYCRSCLYLGRLCACDRLEERFLPCEEQPSTYKLSFTLSPEQQRVSRTLVDWGRTGGSGLVHAVCGAGKTEITFELISECVRRRQRVLIVSPRKDVAIEWADRLTRAFDCPITRLYGGEGTSEIGMITVATAPLLVRFRRVFDRVIVDESDAFPFTFDVRLWWILSRVSLGGMVLITATPSVWQRCLPTVHMSRRYHGHPLPVPRLERQTCERVAAFCLRHDKPRLLFVPTKEDLWRWRDLLEASGIHADVVSADTSERLELLEKLERKRGVVLATSIWERGMTVRDVQVAILEADHRQFGSRALIQMAGRAGRRPDAPNGEVVFFYTEHTFSLHSAIRAIKAANAR